jgi:hypothetical protein
MDTFKLIIFTDTLFANNTDLLSQIGYIIVLIDNTGKANIIYWLLIKCKRVTKSTLAIELYKIAYGFDSTAAIKSTINKILFITTPLILYTDLKSLINYLVRLSNTNKKRLMIDIMYLCQAYKRREIAEIKWINSNTNSVDIIMKSKACNALTQLININYIQLEAIKWVKRANGKE